METKYEKRLLQQIQDIMNAELDSLNNQQTEEERNETIDNVKLNTVIKISEIKLLNARSQAVCCCYV